jgi:hypothetical protein
MSTAILATRKDIDDVLNVLDIMMTRIDERSSQIENTTADTQKQIQNIFNQLDHIDK